MKPLIILFILAFNICHAEKSPKCPGEEGYFYTNDKSKRNPRKGGFVSNSANVGDYVFIAPTAAVCNSASVLKYARVYGNAIIKNEAEVTDKARVYGNSTVSGEAIISAEAKVSGNANVSGSAEVKGSAHIKGYYKFNAGSVASGVFTAPKPAAVAKKEAATNAANKAAADKKQAAEFLSDAKNSLKWIQGDLKQGWFGEDKNAGYFRSFKFSKDDIKPPCGFYMNLTKEESVLDSHCTRTKRIKRRRWSPKYGDYKIVKNCKKIYEKQGRKYFDLAKLSLSDHTDYNNDRKYIHFNSFYFYVGSQSSREKMKEKIRNHAKKYCGLK